MALRYWRFASKYCRMAGVRLAGGGNVAGESGLWDTVGEPDGPAQIYDHTAVLILALDTTTRAGSVAVIRDDETLSVVEGDPGRTHGERLPGEIEAALTAARTGMAAVDLLVVASGPGAFTGLRIGLAAVQGIALGRGIATPLCGFRTGDKSRLL